MSSLESTLQKQFTDKVKAEFRKFCLLLQAYSDSDSWVYECDFILTDDIFWDDLTFYGGGQSVDMEGLVKYFFEYVIKADINTDELWDYVDGTHDATETGWLYFVLDPKFNKMKILMDYDYYDNQDRDYQEHISDVIEIYSKKNQGNQPYQFEMWEEEGAIFKFSYEGSDFNYYIDNDCTSNVGIIRTPVFLEKLADIMIQTYEKDFEMDDDGGGGSGWITVNFKEGIITMEHTEYNKSTYEVELAELNF